MEEDRTVSRINSSSEPNLNTAGRRLSRTGFPPGTTVDELWLYRRKRPSEDLWPIDNIKLREGSFKLIKSEYTRRFKNFRSYDNLRDQISPVKGIKPEDHLKIEGPYELYSLYKENFGEYPIEKTFPYKPNSSFQIIDSNENEMRENPRENERLLTEISSKYIEYPIVTRPPLVKKPTNLKLEGDFYSTTEKAENFIQYLISARPVLTKRPTTLKLDGDMDTKTENREQFVPFEITKRPPLCKKFTNLHLEGDLNIVTEKQDQFVRYEVQKRPPLIKKHTNLVIEGELNMIPEYRREYVEYIKAERPKLSLPVNNLKTDGFYDVVSDVSKSVEQQIHPQIPNLRGEEHHDVVLRPRLGRTRENSFIRSEGPMETETESRTQFIEKPSSKNEPVKVTNNLQLEGRIDLNPEYRNAYIDYKDTSSAPRTRRSRRAQENLRTEGKMDVTPEYKSSYIDFPRRRPQVKRPENSLSSEGEIDHMTEKNEKYVPFTNVPRTGPLKRDPELKLEGNIECQPEYRKAYIDYLIRERVERKHRPLDNLGRQPKRIIEDEPIQKTANQPKIEPVTEEKPKSGQPKRPKSTRNRSLSQIETSVFGPKLPLPEDRRRASSRTSSPHGSSSSRRRSRTLPRTQNVSNSSDSDAPSRKYKTFGKPVLVENLASRSTTPVLPLIDVSAKNKWMRDSSIESSSAFVVLDKNVKRDKWPHW